jgi:branched-chain amino acid transport system ATP-binding protein
VLIGPNGAGKTTLFNCITGSLPPTSGRIFLFGKEVTHVAEHRRTAMGLGRTYQITNVFQNLTVLENIILSMQGTSRKKWVFGEGPLRNIRVWKIEITSMTGKRSVK